MNADTTVAFVTNFCPHYRVRTFELLSERINVQFLFFSGGDEWYWPSRFGVRRGNFPHEYLPGVTWAGTRIVPELLRILWRRKHHVIVKCINGRFALPAAYLVARLRRRPFVLWTGVWQRIDTPAHRLLHPLTRHIYRRSDAIAVYGEHVRRFLVQEEGVKPERVFVAPHATDAEPYQVQVPEADLEHVRTALGIPPAAVVILFAGRLEAAKGVHDLFDAIIDPGMRDTFLLLVGDGAEKGALEAGVRTAGVVDRVRFVSNVSPVEMPAYYALADVLVLPSRTTATFKEPWGLVVNEAFYQSVPAVTTDAVGAAAGGLVEDEVTGLVVPERDPDALRRAIRRLADDADLRRRLGANARHRIENWTNDRMVDGFIRAIEYALESRTRT